MRQHRRLRPSVARGGAAPLRPARGRAALPGCACARKGRLRTRIQVPAVLAWPGPAQRPAARRWRWCRSRVPSRERRPSRARSLPCTGWARRSSTASWIPAASWCVAKLRPGSAPAPGRSVPSLPAKCPGGRRRGAPRCLRRLGRCP